MRPNPKLPESIPLESGTLWNGSRVFSKTSWCLRQFKTETGTTAPFESQMVPVTYYSVALFKHKYVRNRAWPVLSVL